MALEAKCAAFAHLPEEALESYAFGHLPDAELASFEEHLLICEHCRERLDAEDHFAEAMRAIAGMPESAAITASPAAFWSTARARLGAGLTQAALSRWRTPVWGAALVTILAVGVVAWRPGMRTLGLTRRLTHELTHGSTDGLNQAEVADIVVLKTLRGGSADGSTDMAEARPDRPLELSIDFTDAGSSLPEAIPYRLEVVDAAGNRAWTGTAYPSASSGKITARLEKRLSAGVYWVRLYVPSGKLLREFGLRLG